MNFLATPDLVSTVFIIFTCFEIPINLFGTYCILCKTPNSMKSVKWAILNLHFWSALMDFSWSVSTRPIVLLPAFSGTTNGVLNHLQIPIVVQFYFVLCLFSIVSVSIVAVFENRYFILFAQNTNWKHYRWPFLAINILPMVAYFIPIFYENPGSEVASRYFEKEFPEIPFSQYQKGLFSFKFDRFYVLSSIFFYGLMLTVEVFVLGFLLCRNLKKSAFRVKVSARTYEMQKKFLIAVVLQISIPFTLLVGPALYFNFSILTLYYNQVLNNFAVLVIPMHGWVSTITMLLIHEPYRNFCLLCVGFQRKLGEGFKIVRSKF